jgi:hypothetical protein
MTVSTGTDSHLRLGRRWNLIMIGLRRLTLGAVASVALSAGIVGVIASPGSGQVSKPRLTGPEKVVQDQVEAYNRHDIEAFLKAYSPENKLYVFPDQEIGKGLDSMRTTYGKLFADNPKLKVEIAKRIVQGEYVIDHEQVSTGTRDFAAVAIYRVQGDKITEVRFLK